MKNIVDISHSSTNTVDTYNFEVILDAVQIKLPGGEVTIDGETYEGILIIRGSGKYERDEEVTILFDNDDLDDKKLEQLELLVMEQFYRLDTNNN
jgi:hypothetical protein